MQVVMALLIGQDVLTLTMPSFTRSIDWLRECLTIKSVKDDLAIFFLGIEKNKNHSDFLPEKK